MDADVALPGAPCRAGTQPQVITPFAPLIEAWLRGDLSLKGCVIYERLLADHGFKIHYQRVVMHLATVRPRIEDELFDTDDNALQGSHRRFEVVGAQVQVDRGEEGDLLARVGIAKTHALPMTLSYSRDPFTCFMSSMDLATFWDCHCRAFTHFVGVPGSVVSDRTRTVIKRYVAPGKAVPLRPEAAAFAEHCGLVIDPLAAYRTTGKGRDSPDCARACPGRPQVQFPRRARRDVRVVADDLAGAGPPHPPGGDQRPRRPGPVALQPLPALPINRRAGGPGAGRGHDRFGRQHR